MEYLFLSDDDKRRVEIERIRSLERAHYAAWLELGELREAGAPDDSTPVQQVIKDLLAIEGTLSHHYKRVAPTAETPTGDDEGVNPDPVGEEAPK